MPLSAASLQPALAPQSSIDMGRAASALPVDGNTLALFHFDTQLGNTTPDATGHYPGTMVNNASIVGGLFSNALRVDGQYGLGSYVRAGSFGALSQGTIEAYVDFGTACNGQTSFTIASVGDFASGTWSARLIDDQGLLNFEILAADGWHVASSGINACRYLVVPWVPEWPYDGTLSFHHVAGTWGPRGMEIWVDGVLHGITYPGYPNNFYFNNGFNCNPQLQTLSYPDPPYPYCPSPRIGTNNYNGVYTGGIPANTTLVIGCALDHNPDNCFGGRIDDFRISNIQRTFTVDIVPPSYPPDKTSREYAVDPYTVALYHLDSLGANNVVPDASGHYDAVLRGTARLVGDGRYNGSLFVDGNNSYAFTTLVSPQYGTVEAWTKIYDTYKPFSALSIGTEPGGGGNYFLSLGMPSNNGTLGFGINGNAGWNWVDSGLAASSLAGCWHHLAGTWGIRGVEVWVDGIKRGSNGYTGSLHANGGFLLGCDGWKQCSSGYIDEVRLSNVQRTFLTPDVLAPVRSRAPGAPTAGGFSYFLPWVNTTSVAPPLVCPWG